MSQRDRIDHRRIAERLLSQSFMDTVKNVAKGVHLLGKGQGNPVVGLTEYEKGVMSKYTYYGWVPAVLSGFGTFCCLFGGARYGAYRRSLKSSLLPGSPAYHARTSQKRQAYQSLDQRPGDVVPKATSKLASETPTKFNIFADEIVVQVQFLGASFFAILVATAVGNLTMDRHEFYRNLAEVPLQPGKSLLCREMCPQLMARTSSMADLQSLDTLYAQREASAQKLPEADREHVLRHVPSDLLDDPHTEDLEQVLRLIQNCKLRMEFEAECRKRDNHRVDPSDGLVDVPKPGVPLHFIKQGSDP